MAEDQYSQEERANDSLKERLRLMAAEAEALARANTLRKAYLRTNDQITQALDKINSAEKERKDLTEDELKALKKIFQEKDKDLSIQKVALTLKRQQIQVDLQSQGLRQRKKNDLESEKRIVDDILRKITKTETAAIDLEEKLKTQITLTNKERQHADSLAKQNINAVKQLIIETEKAKDLTAEEFRLKKKGLQDANSALTKEQEAIKDLLADDAARSKLSSKYVEELKHRVDFISQEVKQNRELEASLKSQVSLKGRFREIAEASDKIAGSELAKYFKMESISGAILEGWKKVYSTYKDLDKTAVEFGKTTNKTREESWKTLQNFNYLTRQSGKLTDTSEKFLKANTDINKLLGTGAVLSAKTLSQYSELANLGKFEKETMDGLVMSSTLNNTTLEQSTKNRLAGMKVAQMTYGVQLDERALLKDIGKVANSIKISYMGQEQALSKAAAQAKIMGTELNKMDAVAESLMDFEGSINAQMEAEVLTGRTLNLERARYYALTNDIGGMMTELNAQGIDAEKFSKLNRIQQEAIAKSMGMSKESMAEMLIQGKATKALGATNFEDAKKKYLADVASIGVAKANAKLGDDALATQLQQITNEERRELAQSKMGDSMQELVAVMKNIDDVITKMYVGFSKIGTVIESIAKAFMVISGMQLVKWLMGGGLTTASQNLAKISGKTAETGAKTGAEAAANLTKATGGSLSKAALEGAGKQVISSTGKSAGKALYGAAANSALKSGTANVVSSGVEATAKTGGGGILAKLGGFIGKGGLSGLGKLLKGSLAPLVETYFANSDLNGMIADKEGIDNEKLKQLAGQRLLAGLGSVLGGAGAGVLTGALTAMGIPAFLASGALMAGGSAIGGFLGNKLGEVLPMDGIGKVLLNSLYSKQLKESRGIAELANGGVAQTAGIAKVDTGEFVAGKNSADTIRAIFQNTTNSAAAALQNMVPGQEVAIMKEMLAETRQQNKYLATLVNKDAVLTVDGQVLASVVGKSASTSYGNRLNPSSRTYA